jgi:beta-N-acetylhexosaminidase
MQGLRDGGIIPCVKHFPGHGGADRDSHFTLPVVNRSLKELMTVELLPFIHACRNEVETLMTGHVLYPALDAKFPATLSHAILTGLLRQQLSYDGVVFSDDMEMKAIENYANPDLFPSRDAGQGWSPQESALIAVRAGVNVLLYGHELTRVLEAFQLLCSEAERHAAIRTRVEKSYHRIVNLKHRFLKRFAAKTDGSLAARLAGLGHGRWVNGFTASGRRCS